MKPIIKVYSREYLFLLIAGIIIFFYILPYFVLGQDANLLIHDNLDSGFALQKVLVDTKSLFVSNSTLVEPVMGGVPRSSFSSEFNIMLFWLWLFNPIWAYIINRVIITLIAFIGIYLLLSKHIIPGKENKIIHAGVALTFSLLPGLLCRRRPFSLRMFTFEKCWDVYCAWITRRACCLSVFLEITKHIILVDKETVVACGA